jgi:hypothetical protein
MSKLNSPAFSFKERFPSRNLVPWLSLPPLKNKKPSAALTAQNSVNKKV